MPKDNKPVHEVRIGSVKAAIWRNETQNGVRFNASFTKLYKEGDEWKHTDSFGRDELLVLAKVADQAHTWMTSQPPEEFEERRPQRRPEAHAEPEPAGAGGYRGQGRQR